MPLGGPLPKSLVVVLDAGEPLVHCCTLSLCYLGAEMILKEIQIYKKDHLVGDKSPPTGVSSAFSAAAAAVVVVTAAAVCEIK